jgi:CHAT domain-containing protein/Tfp pilus assembly protein PilF
MCRETGFRIAVILALLLGLSCSQEDKQSETPSANEPTRSASDSSQTSITASSHADKIFARAAQLYQNSRYDSATVYFEKASALYEAAQNWAGYVRACTEMAGTLSTANLHDQAEAKLNHAFAVGMSRLGEHHPDMAPIYEILGRFCVNKNDYDNAISYFQKELAIRQAATGGSEQDKIADAHIRIGMMYADKGHYDQAVQSLQQALAVRKAVDPELRTSETGDLYFYFGSLHIYRGEYDLALEYYSKTMAIWKALQGDSLKGWAAANLYHNLGLVHQNKGNYLQALRLFQKSLAMCLEEFGERHSVVAIRYQGMGNAYLEMGDYVKALEFHQKSLDINLSLYGERNHSVSYGYGNLGIVYARKGDYGKALPYYQKALAIMKAVLGQRHPDIAECCNLIGDLHLQKGDYQQALVMFQQAQQANVIGFTDRAIYHNPSLQQVLSEEKLLESLQKKAKALIRRAAVSPHPFEDLQAALSTSQLAVELIDRIRRGYKAEGAKLFLAEKTTETYEQAIQIAHALYRATGDPQYEEQAWQFAEKSRAGILLDALAEAEAKNFAGIPDSLLEKERRLRAELAFQEKRVLEAEAKGSAADSVKILAWQAELFDLKRAYENLLAHFEARHPDYFNLKYQNKIANATEIREQLLDEHTALVEYFVGRDSLYIFALANDRLDLKSAPRDSLLEQRVAELRSAIVEQDYDRYARAAYALHQILLAPMAPALDCENFIIIPDGALCFVPFEALLTDTAGVHAPIKDYRALPFLLKKHALRYGYSATMLLETARRQRGPLTRDYLAFAPLFADGVASTPEQLLFTENSSSAEFLAAQRTADTTRAIAAGFLPATKEEVRGVQNLFRERAGFFAHWFGNDAQVRLEHHASEAYLKSTRLADFRYLHFATHGFVNESKPKLSGLLLAPIASQKEDGILYLGEIYNLNLNADLVVLSACETGLGKMAKGEGLIGLGRGFLYAGAANLLVSLWQVNDASTANLMIDFYEKMLEGKSKTAALREAKLHLIERQAKYAKPYYWAPFVLMGK